MALGLRRREGGMARVPGGGGLKVRLWSWKGHKDVQLDPTKAWLSSHSLATVTSEGGYVTGSRKKAL